MGISLRLYALGGDAYVPAAVRADLDTLYNEATPTASAILAECRVAAFRAGQSIEVPADVFPRLRANYLVAARDPRWRAVRADEAITSSTYDQLIDGDPTLAGLWRSSHLCTVGQGGGVYLPCSVPTITKGSGFSIGGAPNLSAELAVVGPAMSGLPDDVDRYLLDGLTEMARLSIQFGTALVMA